jgi:iron complex outermembrane receptor protein
MIHNLQVLDISLQSGGAVSLQNAGEARIRGADVDVTWQPLPERLPGLVLTGSSAYLDGKYLSYLHAFGFDPTTGLVQTENNYSGNRSVRAPRITATSTLNYRSEFNDGVLEAGTDVYFNGGYFFDAQNVTKQHPYYLVGAHASYLYQPLGLKINFFGKNLNGAEYFFNKFQTDFDTVGTYAPPRTYGVRLDYAF